MKIPLINRNDEISQAMIDIVAEANRRNEDKGAEAEKFNLVSITDLFQAIEYINYQMPPLLILSFAGSKLDGFEVMQRIAADPWLNHGGIIAVYEDMDTFSRINALENTNIIISLHKGDMNRQMPTVLEVIRQHRHFLFQRALHTDLLSSMTISGNFELGMDLMLVPCYANLVANYLFNVGFLAEDDKSGLSLVITELLTNAIEHGNCEIGGKDKSEYLKNNATIQELVIEKCRDPKIMGRKVNFHYKIGRKGSEYTIRDEGKGFKWKKYLADEMEVDYLSPHGRGILLTREIAERMSYNDQGNEVTLSFQHPGNRASNLPPAFSENEVVEFEPGDVVFEQGEESDFLYYLAEGVYSVEVGGIHVDNLTPDDVLVGEMSFLLEEVRSATVVATTSGKLIKISKKDFINIIQNQPYYGLFLSKLIAQRLHRLNRKAQS